jgi:hypothetical protein
MAKLDVDELLNLKPLAFLEAPHDMPYSTARIASRVLVRYVLTGERGIAIGTLVVAKSRRGANPTR